MRLYCLSWDENDLKKKAKEKSSLPQIFRQRHFCIVQDAVDLVAERDAISVRVERMFGQGWPFYVCNSNLHVIFIPAINTDVDV